ncbi:NADPH:quinone reductase-like Zn-dependent oxidoreductase [Streptomyces fulvorobeus]|nr:NADPH:quinone reductase-like Zn-dependent oxidoreductase [Streptomyces fulvorobeus]
MPKAYVFTRYGGPEVEAFADLPMPRPGPGELLVAVRAAGVDPVDWKLRDGYTRPGSAPVALPAVLGSEASGTVVATGPDTDGFAPGQAVFGCPLTIVIEVTA